MCWDSKIGNVVVVTIMICMVNIGIHAIKCPIDKCMDASCEQDQCELESIKQIGCNYIVNNNTAHTTHINTTSHVNCHVDAADAS